MRRRSRRSRRPQRPIWSAARTMARRCAMPRRWSRLPAKAARAPATVQAAVQRVEAARATLRPTSTQEDAWLLLAASAMAKDAGKVSLDVGGEATQRPLYRTIRAGDLKEPLRVTNTGEDQVQAVVTVTGAPLTPEPAAENGFKIERQTYTLDGDPVDAKEVKQNTRLVVVLKITEAQPQFGRVIVADYLPAGFEIDNPHLVSSGDTGTLSWITDAVEPVEYRVPRRPLHRGVRAQEGRSRRCSPSPTWCARFRPANTCGRRRASRTCIVPTATAAPRPGTSK